MTVLNKSALATSTLAFALLSTSAFAENLGAETRTGLDLTLHQNGMAVITDKRLVPLKQGTSTITLEDTAKSLDPTTAFLSPADNKGGMTVLSQTRHAALAIREALLRANLGKEVTIIRPGKEEAPRKGKLVGYDRKPILEIDGKIHTNVRGELVFDHTPEGLTDKDGLVFRLASETAAPRELNLTYQTTGLAWQANYVAVVDSNDAAMSLQGRANINNTCGLDLTNATTTLVAGDLNRVRPTTPLAATPKLMMAREGAMDAEDGLQREAFSGYHLYKLDSPLTLANNASIQVSLLQAGQIKTTKEYIFRSSGGYYYNPHHGNVQPQPAAMRYRFTNTPENGIGLPLPAGPMRIYKKSADGGIRLIGENQIGNTAVNQEVTLNIGQSFDVTAKHSQTDFKKIANRENESEHRIEITNGAEQGVTVKVVENIPGDWEILRESHKHTKTDAYTASWTIPVPAKGKVQLKYQVRNKL